MEALASLTSNPDVATLVGDPKLTDDQLCDLIAELCAQNLPKEAANLLRVVIENGRLEAMPEIARQFRELKNSSEGTADAYIESVLLSLAPLSLTVLLESLAKKFPGIKLNPVVAIKPELIGGVCIHVGDKLLDGSIRARLAQMKTTLTA